MPTTDQAHTYDQIELGNRAASGLYFEAEAAAEGKVEVVIDHRARTGARY